LSVTGDNSFLIEDIITQDQVVEIIQSSVVEVEESDFDYETISLISTSEVSQMMSNYYSDLELAFNDYGFSYIADYYDVDGEEYAPTEAYISKAINENMEMLNHELIIESVEVYDDNHYLVTIYVQDEYHYQDKVGDIKEVQAEYLIEVTPESELKIEKLLNLDILMETEI
jgi:hypothetical protein